MINRKNYHWMKHGFVSGAATTTTTKSWKKKKSMEETNTLKYVLLYEENSEKWFKIVVEFCYKSKI